MSTLSSFIDIYQNTWWAKLNTAGLYVPKIIKFIDAFSCYKQKRKLAPFNLAIPVQRLTQSASSIHSTCPNHLKLSIFTTKLTGSIPNDFLSSAFFLLSFSVTKFNM